MSISLKRINFLLFTIFFTTGFFSACLPEDDENRFVREERTIGSINEIEVEGNTELYIKQGKHASFYVEGYENSLTHFKTETAGKILKIKYKKDIEDLYCRATLTVNKLTAITCRGKTNIVILTPLNAGSIKIKTVNDAQINGSINCNDMSIESSGNLTASFGGSAQSFKLISYGKTNLHAIQMKVLRMAINAEGKIAGEVFVKNELTIALKGSGELSVKGSPKINRNVSGECRLYHYQK